MIGIIGRKLGMTQIFNEQGQQIPVTVVEAEPNPVTKVVAKELAGFAAVELGMGAQRLVRVSKKGERTPRGVRATKAEVAHAAKAGLSAPPTVLRSFRLDDAPGKNPEIPVYAVGDTVTVGIFTPGDTVKVTGTSKGHGFQGVVKRYGFHGGPNTHGNTKHRRPGSIGAGTDPSRVIKGKKMPGQYGNTRHTQTHLRVEKIDAERNLIYIRGSVAGPKNGIVMVRKQG
ncbi:MAG: 50S ribosomal protein L3 [Gemmatimonadetes bacterium]|nr:MAG: 50S ribosomal protein L3 [Gemmatimonadota bacterium]GDX86401.1 50S ribosomal protein L3 [Gemmatimonadota bacterium]